MEDRNEDLPTDNNRSESPSIFDDHSAPNSPEQSTSERTPNSPGSSSPNIQAIIRTGYLPRSTVPDPVLQDNSLSNDSWSRTDEENSNMVSIVLVDRLQEESRSTTYFSNDTLSSNSNIEVLSDQINKRKDFENDKQPPSKMPRLSSPKKEDQDGETCPICFDVWDNSGAHRLVALKCGHLFGNSCVERWLKSQPVKDRTCPTCKSKSHIRDIRNIYARKLIGVDTVELTSLQRNIAILQSDKVRTELELHQLKLTHRRTVEELEMLRGAIRRYDTSTRKNWKYRLEKNLEISKDAKCRVLAYNCRTYEWYVSHKGTNSLFPGFGVRTVNCVDYSPGQIVQLHSKPIRDISYSQPLDLLLTVSLDGCAKLVKNSAKCLTIQCGSPLWSCSWDVMNDNNLYVGGVGGHVLHYDIRKSSTPLKKISESTDVSPVVSLCSTQYGLLSCHLNSSWLRVSNESHLLPVEGPFMCLNYDFELQKALISCRPGNSSRSRLNVCQLKYDQSKVVCEVEKVFTGSSRASVMSRSCFVRAGTSYWVAAHSESESILQLYSMNNDKDITLPASDPTLDVCSAQINGDTVLGALSENRLRIYKAVSIASNDFARI